jgi:pyrroloquinoline-quinone synthase
VNGRRHLLFPRSYFIVGREQEAMRMEQQHIWPQIETILSRHDLLQHPFYQEWTAGKLHIDDLRRYAQEYYHHVSAFPTYLSALHARLQDGPLRRAVLQNLCEEELGRAVHSDLWLDFAEGVGASRERVRESAPSSTTRELIQTFRKIASERPPIEALGAFYAYESQVARIAGLKAQGLRDRYDADAKTCAYFVLHAKEDVRHSRVWAEHIEDGVARDNELTAFVVSGVEDAAAALWKSMDGIHQSRN